MKTLCLFRHAKSTWGALGTDDIDRPLHEVGETNAPMMGKQLARRGLKPDVILTSNAKRALSTAALIAKPLKYPQEKIVVDEKLYDAGVEDLLHVIEAMDDKFKTLLLIGHNPGLTLLANYLADEHVNNLPTCGVFCLEIKTDKWQNFGSADSKILFTDEPRNYQ